MEVPGPHIRVNQISAISNEGRSVHDVSGRAHAAVFLTFLTRLVAGRRERSVDRGPIASHKTPAVEAWVEAHGDRIEVFDLPAYSPELNR